MFEGFEASGGQINPDLLEFSYPLYFPVGFVLETTVAYCRCVSTESFPLMTLERTNARAEGVATHLMWQTQWETPPSNIPINIAC